MEYYSKQISRLIEELSKLPGIGANRPSGWHFHILNMPQEEVERLSEAMVDARKERPLLQGVLYADGQ